MKSALHGLKPSSAARAKDGEFPEAQTMDVCASGRGGWICLPHFFIKMWKFSEFTPPSHGALTFFSGGAECRKIAVLRRPVKDGAKFTGEKVRDWGLAV